MFIYQILFITLTMDLFSLFFVTFFNLIVSNYQKSVADKENNKTNDFASILKHSIEFKNATNIIEYLFNTKNTTLPMPYNLTKLVYLLPMLKHFYEIEISTKTGNPITKSDIHKEAVTDTPNYKLFRNFSINQQYSEFVRTHLGRYPVILMNFSLPNNITTFADAFHHCTDLIHEAYKQHWYLINSRKLEDGDKEMCRKWCNDIEYRNLTSVEYFDCALEDGIMNLTRYLHKHFDKEYIVLVDEYDKMFRSCIVGERDTFIQSSVLYRCIIEAIFIGRKESAPVGYGVMIGTSDIVIHLSRDADIPALYEILRREHNILINRYYGFNDFALGI